MSQLNNNNNNGNGRVINNNITQELRELKTERELLDRRNKQIRFRCNHKDNNHRGAVTMDQETGLLKCRICGVNIDPKLQNKVEVDRKIQEVINIIECIKLAGDNNIVEMLAKVEEGLDSVLNLYEKVILKGTNNNKNKNRNNNNNQRKASYGKSML